MPKYVPNGDIQKNHEKYFEISFGYFMFFPYFCTSVLHEPNLNIDCLTTDTFELRREL